MRSERLLATLLMLQAKRRSSARELARELGVSVRTIYRDVGALGAAGVPIFTERGPQGGIVLPDDYRRALAQFGADDISALFAAATNPLDDLGIAAPRRALEKIEGALSERQRRAAEGARERLLVDAKRWYRGEQPTDVLAVLRAASADDRRIVLTYRDRAGASTERRADPFGLVAKAGVWYLVARTDEGMRTFRAERITGAAPLLERFVRPADFSLTDYWQRSIASLEERPQSSFVVTARVAAADIERVTSFWDVEVCSSDGQAAIVRMRFPNRRLAAFGVLATDADLEILDPPDLADAVVASARAALERFARPEDELAPSAQTARA